MAKRQKSKGINRPLRPSDLHQPTLRRIAGGACELSQLREAMDYLEGCQDFELDMLRAEAELEDIELHEDHPVNVALNIIYERYEELDTLLEAEFRDLFAQDHELWGRLQLDVINPWQKQPGRWRKRTPYWVLVLATNGIMAARS